MTFAPHSFSQAAQSEHHVSLLQCDQHQYAHKLNPVQIQQYQPVMIIFPDGEVVSAHGSESEQKDASAFFI